MKKAMALLFALLVACSIALPVFSESTTPTDPPIVEDVTTSTSPEGSTNPSGETVTTATAPEAEPGEYTDVLEIIKNTIKTITRVVNTLTPTSWITAISTTLHEAMNHAFLNAMDHCIDFTASLGSDFFFGNDFVKESLSLFRWIAGILLPAGFLINLLQMAEKSAHGERISVFASISGLLKGYGMLLFVQPVMMLLMDMFKVLSDALSSISTSAPPFTEAYGQTLSTASLVDMISTSLVTLVIFVVTIIMVFRIFKRFGVMYIQILTGYLYVYDLSKGNNVIGEWGRDVISGFITFHLQLTFFNVGIKLLALGLSETGTLWAFTNGNILVGLVLLASIGAAPAVLRRFGYANQTAGGLGRNLMQGAATTVSIAARFI